MEAAFFDLDKTVIAKASMVAFGRPLLRAGVISRRLLLRAAWSQLVFHHLGADEERMRRFRESALRVTRGWDQHHIRAIVDETLVAVIEPIVYDEALALIRQHQAAGRRVLIVSASPEEIVQPLASYLQVDGAIASRPRIDADGRYTGEVEFYSYGPFKAEAIRAVAADEGIDLDASYAYSDSITDLPMLEVVGHPVVVNPDRELGRVARQRGWEVQHFRATVPLRDRVPMPPAPRVALAVGATAAAAVALGAWGWWWTRRRAAALAPTATEGSGWAGRRARAPGLRRPGAS
jgi:HAD superfamily hydrolase (TIGR01490 family)